MLYQGNTRMSPFIRFILFRPGMGRMVCSNYIQAIVQQTLPQSLFIVGSLDSGIALDKVTKSLIITAGKMKVMHTNFIRYSFFFMRHHFAEQLQIFFLADMEYM